MLQLGQGVALLLRGERRPFGYETEILLGVSEPLRLGPRHRTHRIGDAGREGGEPAAEVRPMPDEVVPPKPVGDCFQILTYGFAQLPWYAGAGQVVDRSGEVAQVAHRIPEALIERNACRHRPFQPVIE